MIIKKIIKYIVILIVNKLNNVPHFLLIFYRRYTKIYTKLLNKNFLLVDSRSYYASYNEIFIQEIYKFRTSNQDCTIIDCGVNIGTSILYFKSIHPMCKVIGFEADKNVFEVCKENIKQFGYSNIELYNVALWDEITEIEFMSEGADGGRIDSRIENISTNKISTTLLSNYINSPIEFLKIDIEGAEYRVLNEIKAKLSYVKNIFIEYHSFNNEEQKLDQILIILKEEGFRYQIKSQFSSKFPYIEKELQLGMDLQLNIFGYKED
jgi:FkbM family methyltransferase